MDLNSFFRRFFNIPSSQRDSFEADKKNRVDPFFDDPFERFNSSDPAFRQMEDMFNNVFSLSFDILGDFPKFSEEEPEQLNPRSIMLKDSDERNISVSEKESEGTNELPIVSKRGHLEGPSISFSKVSSIRTVYLPDGVIEEYKTVTDSNGKKTTHVRRSIGDTTHEVITKSDKQGLQEKEENFLNMDENECHDFDKIWKTFKSRKDPDAASSPSLSIPPSNPSYLYLLKKFFGSSQNEEPKWC